MKCKNCGGEILFQNGKGICESCGSIFALENAYESIDVFLCYEESDSSGRRTKDSIIAQEVYQKLEANKIHTFYERVSADGVIGDDLEQLRRAAICKAKAVLVLGTSAAHFAAMEEKYGDAFSGKTVIPFCVDLDPGAIPQSLSKIQAINYTTIGWERDLTNGLYRLLGREKEVNTGSLYGKEKKKKTLILCLILAIVLLLAAGVAALFLLRPEKEENALPTQTEDAVPATTEETETLGEVQTEPSLTPKEIFAKASALLDEGKKLDALHLFLQIPDYPGSANKIKLIYAKYEGYYKNGEVALHLDIADNTSAEVEVTITSDSSVVRFSASTVIEGDTVVGEYRDNHQKTGSVELKLEEDGLRLALRTNEEEVSETFFPLTEKSDEAEVKIDAATLISWVENKITSRQVQALGYELEIFLVCDRAGDSVVYKIKDTEILLSTLVLDGGESATVFGVQAPAGEIAPSCVGRTYFPFIAGDLLYCPDGYLICEYVDGMGFATNFDSQKESISEDTPIGIVSKKTLSEAAWDSVLSNLALEAVELSASRKYSVLPEVIYPSAQQIAENETHFLITFSCSGMPDPTSYAWYRVAKEDLAASFVREGPFQGKYGKISQSLWFSEYLEFAAEFPDTFDILPGSEEWNEYVEEAVSERAVDDVREKYPESAGAGISYETIAQNDTHFLICLQTAAMEEKNKCAWYEGDKKTAAVRFLKEGPYGAQGYNYDFSKILWFKEYPDLAKAYPSLYGDPDEVSFPYLQDLPYSVTFSETFYIYNAPSFSASDSYYASAAGTYTIVEEAYDKYNDLWGKIESKGWVCLSDHLS